MYAHCGCNPDHTLVFSAASKRAASNNKPIRNWMLGAAPTRFATTSHARHATVTNAMGFFSIAGPEKKIVFQWGTKPPCVTYQPWFTILVHDLGPRSADRRMGIHKSGNSGDVGRNGFAMNIFGVTCCEITA
jgi:hypothetical protein